jgi:hypothetical protein
LYFVCNRLAVNLVIDPAEWRWSSYNWYVGCADVPISMDKAAF